jgi:hypothetical protein
MDVIPRVGRNKQRHQAARVQEIDAGGTAQGQNELLVRFVALVAIVVGAAYLIWRAGWTINPNALWLAIPLLLAEAHGYLTLVVHAFMT